MENNSAFDKQESLQCKQLLYLRYYYTYAQVTIDLYSIAYTVYISD